jgi:transposase InsO family protein
LAERQRVVALIQEAMYSGARQQQACEVLELSVRTYQRWVKAGVVSDGRQTAKRPAPANKLSEAERQRILAVCNTPAYAHLPPYQIVPRLADQGIYMASESSFYRILKAANQLNHRGSINIKTKTNKVTSFTASQPNQVWSWDITYLPSRIIGQHYYLYMIEDIYSRKAVGCEVYDKEEGEHAAVLLERSIWKEKCVKRQLVLHSDNGGPMKSMTLRAKLQELGVVSSYSRPRVSNDNPYSESLFRTVKYHPRWPSEGFGSLEDARRWAKDFTQWYNHDHRHSRIKFVTPQQRHNGEDIALLKKRHALYTRMKRRHPERWSTTTRNWQHDPIVELNPKHHKESKVA